MPKYQSKPKQIEAIQYEGYSEYFKDELQKLLGRSKNIIDAYFTEGNNLIMTCVTQGILTIQIGDYVVLSGDDFATMKDRQYFEKRYEKMWS